MVSVVIVDSEPWRMVKRQGEQNVRFSTTFAPDVSCGCCRIRSRETSERSAMRARSMFDEPQWDHLEVERQNDPKNPRTDSSVAVLAQGIEVVALLSAQLRQWNRT